MATTDRSRLLVYLSLVIACGSLGAAFYQNYIYTRQLDTIQRNVARGEYIRACRDIIETYFQVKLKVALMTGPGGDNGMFAIEAANAVSRLGGIGTYLANFQNEDVRFRYTQLTNELSRIVMGARGAPEARLEADRFIKADELFAGLNEDCVRTAKATGI
jgi:hypothetical protein